MRFCAICKTDRLHHDKRFPAGQSRQIFPCAEPYHTFLNYKFRFQRDRARDAGCKTQNFVPLSCILDLSAGVVRFNHGSRNTPAVI